MHLDGAVYGQPLLVGNLVIAATENDSVYGLDQATGKVAWRTHVGTPVPLSDLPCGNIDPLGITGTPVYDPASGLVYAVAETSGYHHVLVGVSVRDGSVQVERDIPTPDGQPRYDQQRPALTIAGRAGVRGVRRAGRRLRSVPRLGGGHPAQRQRAADLLRGADPARGRHLGHRRPGHRPGRHHVRQRRQRLGDQHQLRRQRLGDRAVPRTCTGPASSRRPPGTTTTHNDLDLGSTQPALLPDGMLLADGKSGTAYLVSAAHLGGVGGQVAQAQVCPAYGAAAVQGSIVYEPCEQGGLAAVDTAGNKIPVRWRGPSSAWGSPVIGGGAVWVTDWKRGNAVRARPGAPARPGPR